MSGSVGVSLSGIFLLDKPIGISSNAALQKVKRLFKATQRSVSASDRAKICEATIKAGHTGSLDPLATGLLPICFGDATKYSQYLLDSDKTYAVTMQLGVRTTTSDAEGAIVSTKPVPDFSLDDINQAFDFFRGETQQIPSMFSALKHTGVPLYEYARRGIEIQRESRKIIIYNLDMQSYDNPHAQFTVKCSKGTYIRTLVDDVGERLGCGAHVTQLRRLTVGPFDASQMMTIAKLELLLQQKEFDVKKLLLPVDTAVQHWPAIIFSDELAARLLQGQTILLSKESDAHTVRLQKSNGEFFGVADIEGNRKVIPKRLVRKVV